MTSMWALLSLLSAFGQALGWALKKKSLQSAGVNNLLACVASLTSGLLLLPLHVLFNGWNFPSITQSFVTATLAVILANITAAWAAYRALDRAPLSLLMPFIAVSSIIMVPLEYVLRGILPNPFQLLGIALVVSGAFFLLAQQRHNKVNLQALALFSVTVLCFSLAPPFMAIAVRETQSPFFTAALMHAGITLGFIPFVILARENKAVRALKASGQWTKTFLLMIAAGAVTALLENGPASVALLSASASEVFALKRTMPLFALILGIVLFHEKVTKRHLAGTLLVITGSILVVAFQ